MLPRRPLLLGLASAVLAPPLARAQDDPVVAPRALAFPADHGAHPAYRIEWWYATGWLAEDATRGPSYGFQLTFFRSRTGQATTLAGRFAGRQLLMAHLALSDLGGRRLRHAERLARWSGDIEALPAAARTTDTAVHIGDWRFAREDAAASSIYRATLADRATGVALRLALRTTQPVLLQGQGGVSRKGPEPRHASHYYSQPQLAVDGALVLDGRERRVAGRAWLDHEWSQTLMPDAAVGWDWIGINLDDGSALTAFRLRTREGRSVWAGGSLRPSGGAVRAFAAEEVRFEPLAWWTSAATRARYPVRWRIVTPAGTHEVHALLDDQELDARASTGTVYWEGLSELRDAGGARRGLGYLEMTGYAATLRL
ncbi:MAG TPA: carotenoid 1,2-hydratase [Burkholderiaceae bacterium]|nr:carotenoid 1,2-hydratase [Burkholderiaceae bacterium]